MSSTAGKEAFPQLQERFSRSLERTVAILELLCAQRPAMGVSEIARELGMGRSSAHRYLSALAGLGYLEQDASRRYRLGLLVAELGLAAWNAAGLEAHAATEMAALARRSGLAVELAVLDGPEVLVLARVEARRRRRGGGEDGPKARRPAHCTAAGKALLAHLPAAALDGMIGQAPLEARAARTITDRRLLRSQLARAQTDGIASAEDELAAGVSAIAAAVHEREVEGAAALSVLAERYGADAEELRERHGAALAAAARAISERLGWREGERSGGRGGRGGG